MVIGLPVRNYHTQNGYSSLKRQESTSVRWRSTLRQVYWRGRRVHPVSDPGYYASNDQLRNCIGGSQDYSPYDHDASASHKHRPSTEMFADEVAGDGADNAAYVVKSRNITLHVGIRAIEVATKAIICADDTGHNACRAVNLLEPG